MREVWCADSETDPFAPGRTDIAAFIWGATNGDEYFEFDNLPEFIEFFIDKKVIVYFHNGGKFDYHLGFWDYLEPFTDLSIIAGRVAKFKIGDCEFRDSVNILPIALADGGEKIKFDYSKMEKENRAEHAEEISEYLEQDCYALYKLVKAFIDEYGLNLTVAGTAIKEWKKVSGIKPVHSSADYYKYFSPYYYGGRVEAYKIGVIDEPLTVVDINSAYPHAMLSNHPLGLEYMRYKELPETDEEIGPTFIKLNCKGNGAFPFRSERGPLTFPRDNITREFTVTGWEYLAARDCGVLGPHQIVWVHIFESFVNFDEYVYQFYNMKNEAKRLGDTERYIFAKLLMNSLYGKFGSNPEKYAEYSTIPQDYVPGAMESGYKFEGDLDGKTAVISKPLEEDKQRFYNVATAASITGCVRAFLFRHINVCAGDIVYCDTDSIVYAGDHKHDFSIGKNIGQWEIEANCIGGAIAGKKLYAFDKGNGTYKMASKGVKLTPDEMYAVARGETVTYTRIAPTFSFKKEPVIISRNVKRASYV
jgi:hypothetical protein